eukprot:CFRG1094T1
MLEEEIAYKRLNSTDEDHVDDLAEFKHGTVGTPIIMSNKVMDRINKIVKWFIILLGFICSTLVLAAVIQSWPYIVKSFKPVKPYADDIHNSDNGLDPDSLPMAYSLVVNTGFSFALKNGGSRRLKNALRPQCLIHDDNNLVRTGSCDDKDVLWLQYDLKTYVLYTPENQCLALLDTEKKGEDLLGLQVSVTSCDYHSFNQKWILGYNLDGQIFNQGTETCVDVEHQHYNAPVILWTCKLKRNYKPRNQMWHWIGATYEKLQ